MFDTTVLVANLRGDEEARVFLLGLLAGGHTLATSCVSVAEIEHGVRPGERKAATALLDRLSYLQTTRDAAERAGRYQAEFRRRGRTLQIGDALIAGTARAHGSILVTSNVKDFPMRDLQVQAPPAC